MEDYRSTGRFPTPQVRKETDEIFEVVYKGRTHEITKLQRDQPITRTILSRSPEPTELYGQDACLALRKDTLGDPSINTEKILPEYLPVLLLGALRTQEHFTDDAELAQQRAEQDMLHYVKTRMPDKLQDFTSYLKAIKEDEPILRERLFEIERYNGIRMVRHTKSPLVDLEFFIDQRAVELANHPHLRTLGVSVEGEYMGRHEFSERRDTSPQTVELVTQEAGRAYGVVFFSGDPTLKETIAKLDVENVHVLRPGENIIHWKLLREVEGRRFKD